MPDTASSISDTATEGGILLRAHLHEITLETPHLAEMGLFYRRALEFRFRNQDEFAVGEAHDRRIRLKEGVAGRLVEACFLAADLQQLDALERRLERAAIGYVRQNSKRFAGGEISFRDPDGNGFVIGCHTIGAERAPPPAVDGGRAARLQHLVLSSTNAQRMVDFHTRVVGFTVSDWVRDEAGMMRTAFLCCSEEHHSLAVFVADACRLDHFCFEAGDWGLIRDWGDHLANQQIAVKWGPGRHGPGNNLFMFFHDPDGNWVEISAELERVGPSRAPGTWPHEERTLNLWGAAPLRS